MEKNGKNMKRIASFSVDHTKLVPGIYVSRRDGDAVTYDIRMKKPNGGDYLGNGELHTIEHLFATYARNSRFSDSVIYIGPMGCRTGFYMVLRDTVAPRDAVALVRESMEFTAGFEGEIPGASEAECGNFREHDLGGAKRTAAVFLRTAAGWTPEKLDYPV